MGWLTQGVRSRKLIINDAKALVHTVAGTAYLGKRDHYRGKGGTGVGVRLFYEFIKRRAAQK